MTTTEDTAVTFVSDYEARHGRVPTDRRYDRDYVADLESMAPDGSVRDIEIKSTKTQYRGWYLSMQPAQIQESKTNPDFYVYAWKAWSQAI